jgi:hypothetical protein
MKHSSYSSLPALALLLGTFTLVGCGGALNLPDSVVSSQASGPAVAGSVYGGHAPIAGSHVYLLEPGTGGYGSIATSILGNNGATSASNGFTLSTNPATGGDPYIPSGWKYVTTDNNGNFYLSGAYNCTASHPVYIYATGGNATGGTATNTGIVQLVILGNCPATGQANFGSGSSDQINYVYSNEVSTVAAAYVFQPFTVQGTATTASAIYVGSSGTTQALLGIENAADTAAQLYSIQGNGQISSSGDGEGHVANSRTQGVTSVGGVPVIRPNIGNGVVPEATINTIANILADCVDSAGGTSTMCTTLFTNATETGDSAGVKPTDIARAAMNIARYPAGNYSTANTPTNFVANIFALGQGTVPYLPRLTAKPNDFTIAIDYPYTPVGGYATSNTDVEKAESLQVDQNGEIWITAQGGQNGSTNPYPSADRWSPLGAADASNPNLAAGNYMYGYVSVDGSNNAWTGNVDKTSGIFEAGGNGAFTTTYGSGYTHTYVVVADNAGDVYFFASNPTTGGDYEMFKYPAGSTIATTPTKYNISPAIIPAGDNVAHAALDASGDFWLTTETSNQIARVTATGANVFNFATPNTHTANDENQPEFPAIDHNGTAWIPIQSTAGQIYKVTSTGATTILTSNGAGGTTATGAELASTFGAAVDGNGNVWVADRSGNYGTVSGVAGTNTILEINGANNQAISPTTNYVPEAEYPTAPTVYTKMLNDSLNVAIDPSGDLWITNYLGNTVVEIVGTAAPVVTPLSYAAASNKLGTKP